MPLTCAVQRGAHVGQRGLGVRAQLEVADARARRGERGRVGRVLRFSVRPGGEEGRPLRPPPLALEPPGARRHALGPPVLLAGRQGWEGGAPLLGLAAVRSARLRRIRAARLAVARRRRGRARLGRLARACARAHSAVCPRAGRLLLRNMGLAARTLRSADGRRILRAAAGRHPVGPHERRPPQRGHAQRRPAAGARPVPTRPRRAPGGAAARAAAQRAAACGARPMPATSKRSAPPPPSRTRRSLAAAAWAAAASQAPRRHASASPASALAASAARAPASTSSASSGSRALGAHAALRSRSSRSSLCAHVRLGPSRQRRGSPRCDAAEHRAAAAGGAPAELRGEREDGVAVRRRRAVGRRAAPQAPRALHARLCVNAVGSIGHILACLRQPRQRRAVGNVRGAVRRVCLPVWIRERGRRRRAAGHAAPHGARGRTVSRRPRR